MSDKNILISIFIILVFVFGLFLGVQTTKVDTPAIGSERAYEEVQIKR